MKLKIDSLLGTAIPTDRFDAPLICFDKEEINPHKLMQGLLSFSSPPSSTPAVAYLYELSARGGVTTTIAYCTKGNRKKG